MTLENETPKENPSTPPSETTTPPSESPQEPSQKEETPNSEPSSEEGVLGNIPEEEPKADEEVDEEAEEYEIDFSEESPLSEDQQNKLAEKIGEYGLNKEQALDLIKEIESTHANASNSVVQQLADKVKKDRDELMNSELFKTEDAQKETFAKIGNVVKQFGDEDFSKFLSSSSGNSLALAKFLVKIADAGANDDPTGGKGASQDGSGAEKTLAEKWYPHLFNKN